MQSTVTVLGNTHDFSVPYGEVLPPTPNDIGIQGAEARWVGSRVRFLQETLAMMQATQAVGAYSQLENPNTGTGKLALTLLSPVLPAAEDVFVITEVRVANVDTMYKVHPYASQEERRSPVRVFEVSQAPTDSLPGVLPGRGRANPHCYVVPVNAVEVIQLALASDTEPAPGIDYVAPEWVVTNYRYSKVDQRHGAFTNRPTAYLAEALSKDEVALLALESLRDARGAIEGPALCKMSFEKRWEARFLKPEDYVTPGFPASYRLQVNYTQLTEHLNSVSVG